MSYRSRDQLISDFNALETQYPTFVSHEYIGKTVRGSNIPLFKVGNPLGGRVMFIGATHGDEPLGSEVLYYFCRWLLERQEPTYADQFLSKTLFLIVPIFNMDNYRVTRKNANAVDLNRNFPVGWGGSGSSADPTAYNYKGTTASSEPETKTMLTTLEKWKPSFLLDIHQFAGPYFARPSNYASVTPTDVERHNTIATAIRSLSTIRTTFALPYLYLGIGGCLADSSYKIGNAISYLTEFESSSPAYADIVPIYLPRFLPFPITYAQNALPPPSPPPTFLIGLTALASIIAVTYMFGRG